MVAKRVVPILQVRDGRIATADGAAPSEVARRLELEGADEILFVEQGAGRALRSAWLTEVARALFIPFALEAPFQGPEELAEALAAGAGRVVVPARDAALMDAPRFGRARVVAALEAVWSAAGGWDEILDGLMELGQLGLGGAVLAAGATELDSLCARTVRLPVPILLRCADPALAAEALAHGADGIAYPADLMTPAEFKARLAGAGVPLRR